MNIDKKLSLIEKLLKKKKESPLLELIIKNYNNSNFYISLLYNHTIEKFKVLYIPLDVVESNKIDEYFCYQFMNIKCVAYIVEQMKAEIVNYETLESRNKRNKNIDNFQIELDFYIDKKKYDFHMTRYLPKDWKFLFEIMTLLFEHVPNIMGELAMDILSVVMNTNDLIEYQASLNCDLWQKDLTELFPMLKEENIVEGNLSFLESVNGKYYAVVENHLLIIEYNEYAKVLNIFCDANELVYSSYTYQVLKAIRDKIVKPFLKVKIIEKEDNYNYLCLGIKKKKLWIIKNNKITSTSLSRRKREEIIILEDQNKELQKQLDEVML